MDAPDLSKYTLTFDDEFNTLSASAGGQNTLWKTTYPYAGLASRTLYSNHEAQYYSDSSVGVNPFSISDGVLDITAAHANAGDVPAGSGLTWTSGLLTTQKSFSQLYGYFEISAQLPAGQGAWPAFWMLPTDGSWPPELDVFEVLGNDTKTMYNSTHSANSVTSAVINTADLSAGFHTYGVDWKADFITWYLDGVAVARQTTPSDMHKPMYMIVNLAVGANGSWPGATNGATPTQLDMKVDYVRAYAAPSSLITPSNTDEVQLGAGAKGINLLGTANTNVTGNDLGNQLMGNEGNNILKGGAGNDVINGGKGADTMIGGGGEDTYYVDDVRDIVIEQAGAGRDTVYAGVSYKLADNVENLILSGAANINGTGNNLGNQLTGNSGNNVLTGGGGNDILNGGKGADTMVGGSGNDTYYVDSINDAVVEQAGGGKDSVFSSVSFKLSANVENLTLTGAENTNGTGNDLGNQLTGNDGNNVLIGGAANDVINGARGADTLIGGAGNDTYYVDNVGDVVIEKVGSGMDTVVSTVTFKLSANVENLTLSGTLNSNGTGNNSGNHLTGNSGANVLTGGDGNDVIDGGKGNDLLIGGLGNDTFRFGVGHGHDKILDFSAHGERDVVDLSSFRTTLGQISIYHSGHDTIINFASGDSLYLVGVDQVKLQGDYLVAATASAGGGLPGAGSPYSDPQVGDAPSDQTSSDVSNNVLIGGEGNDAITGSNGADTMIGGAGNDIYYVNNIEDVVVEQVGGGKDTIYASVSYALANNVDNLSLTGGADINGTGNDLGNQLTGNSGNNLLVGGAGNDIINGGKGTDLMIGGAGNDTYYIDGINDAVIEQANGGTDNVVSTVSFKLADNIECLTLSGSADLTGTGNDSGNQLLGNSGANVLTGGNGNDLIDGGKGNDVLMGGLGNDTFRFKVGDGHDTIMDFFAHGERDAVDLSAFHSTLNQISIIHSGHDTIINFISGESLHLVGVEQVKLQDDYLLAA